MPLRKILPALLVVGSTAFLGTLPRAMADPQTYTLTGVFLGFESDSDTAVIMHIKGFKKDIIYKARKDMEITLDGKPAKILDLKKGCTVRMDFIYVSLREGVGSNVDYPRKVVARSGKDVPLQANHFAGTWTGRSDLGSNITLELTSSGGTASVTMYPGTKKEKTYAYEFGPITKGRTGNYTMRSTLTRGRKVAATWILQMSKDKMSMVLSSSRTTFRLNRQINE